MNASTLASSFMIARGSNDQGLFNFVVNFSGFRETDLPIDANGNMPSALVVRLPPILKNGPPNDSFQEHRLQWITSAVKYAIHDHFFPGQELGEAQFKELNLIEPVSPPPKSLIFSRFGMAFYDYSDL